MSEQFLRLEKRMEEEKRPEFDLYFFGYIHGLKSSGILENGEGEELEKLLEMRQREQR